MVPGRRGVLVAGLLAVSLVSVCSASQPGTFAEWLSAKKATKSPSVAQASGGGGYGPREYEHQCLKEMAYKNCRWPKDDGTEYFESGVTCCDARSNSGNSLGSSNIEVGTCKFTQFWLSSPIEEAPGVSKYGEFEVQCYMNAAADTCGHPFCDQMVLEAAGGIYWAKDVVLVSKPASPLIDDSCDSDKRSAKSPAAKRSSKKIIAKSRKSADGAKAQTAAANNGHSEPSMYSGDAWIYFGPMSVNSRVHDVKITQGWFEYIWDYDPESLEHISEADAEGKHVVDPYTYSLKFYKPSEGGY